MAKSRSIASERPLNKAARAEDGEMHQLRARIEQLQQECDSLKTALGWQKDILSAVDEGFGVIEVIFDSADHPIDCRFLQVNAAFESRTGLKNAIGKTMRELAPAHERHWFDICGQIALTGKPARFTQRAEALGRWHDVYAFRIGLPERRTVAIHFVDITRQKQAEEELRQTKRQLRFVTDDAAALIAHCNAEGRLLFVNAQFAQHLGIPAEDLIGRTLQQALGDRAYSSIQKYVEAALSGKRVEFEEKIVYNEGGEGWMRGVYVPDISSNGQILGLVAVLENVTGRRGAEEALRRSEARFRALMEQAPFSIQVFDPNGRTLSVNRAWEVLWGVHVADIADYNVLKDRQLEEKGIASYLRRAFAGEAVEVPAIQYDPNATLPDRTRNVDPVRWVSAVAYPLHDDTGNVREVVLVHQDITGRHLAEQALARAQEDLREHATRLEQAVADRTARLRESVHELEAFSYSIAHDMRAPLRAMRSFAAILQEEHTGQLDSVGLSYLERISGAAARLDQLIVDILDYSKIVRGELRLQAVDMHRLTRDVIASYPQFDSSRADITIKGPLPPVLGNKAALTQVLSNLLTNAVKFVAAGIRPAVRVSAQELPADSKFLKGSVKLTIEDNGIGVPEGVQPKLFEMFTRFEPKELYDGTGIGLAIVRKAVERMHGKVGVESRRGKGSQFWVQLHRPDDDQQS